MSFGFGVGDFLAIIELVVKVRKEYADAPGHVRDIADEAQNLAILLQHIVSDKEYPTCEETKRLEKAVKSTQNVLLEMHKFVESVSQPPLQAILG